jgi:hypothetical protein
MKNLITIAFIFLSVKAFALPWFPFSSFCLPVSNQSEIKQLCEGSLVVLTCGKSDFCLANIKSIPSLDEVELNVQMGEKTVLMTVPSFNISYPVKSYQRIGVNSLLMSSQVNELLKPSVIFSNGVILTLNRDLILGPKQYTVVQVMEQNSESSASTSIYFKDDNRVYHIGHVIAATDKAVIATYLSDFADVEIQAYVEYKDILKPVMCDLKNSKLCRFKAVTLREDDMKVDGTILHLFEDGTAIVSTSKHHGKYALFIQTNQLKLK